MMVLVFKDRANQELAEPHANCRGKALPGRMAGKFDPVMGQVQPGAEGRRQKGKIRGKQLQQLPARIHDDPCALDLSF
jgi:hypothetical protein